MVKKQMISNKKTSDGLKTSNKDVQNKMRIFANFLIDRVLEDQRRGLFKKDLKK